MPAGCSSEVRRTHSYLLSSPDPAHAPQARAPSYEDFLRFSGGLRTRTHLHATPGKQLPPPITPWQVHLPLPSAPWSLVLSTCGLSGPQRAALHGWTFSAAASSGARGLRGAVLGLGSKACTPPCGRTSDLTACPHLQTGVMLPTLWGCCEGANEGMGLNPPAPH